MTRSPLQALTDAIRIVGSQNELARQCAVAQPTVWKWVHQAKRVSAEFVLLVEAATSAVGEEVHRSELRPDLYPPAEYLAPESQTPGVRPGVAPGDIALSPGAPLSDPPSSDLGAADPAQQRRVA